MRCGSNAYSVHNSRQCQLFQGIQRFLTPQKTVRCGKGYCVNLCVAESRKPGFIRKNSGLCYASRKKLIIHPKNAGYILEPVVCCGCKKSKEEMQWQTNEDRKVTERYANARTDDGKEESSSGIRKTVRRYSNRCSARHKNPH